MHLILNVESLLKPSGGIGRYTRHLLEGIVAHKEVKEVKCFMGKSWLEGQTLLCQLREDTLSSTVPTKEKSSIPQTIKKFLRSVPGVYKSYVAIRNFHFNIQSTRDSSAIYHEPNFILKPFSGSAITTIHDLSHLHYPQYHPKERVEYMNTHFNETLSRAKHIITVSDYVKKELINLLKVDSTKITTIRHGVDDIFKPRKSEDINTILSEYNLLSGSYLLSVSTIEPRKNISQLLDAYMQIEQDIRRKYPLVMVGSDGWNNHEIKKKIKRLEKQGEVKYLGYVSETNLPLIMSGARGFIYIPHYEGFGLPPLEAMASGVPVLTSDVSSLPEVVADVGLMVKPNDVNAISNAIEKLLTDELWRQNSIADGINRAKQFTWDKCIEQTIAVYKSCL